MKEKNKNKNKKNNFYEFFELILITFLSSLVGLGLLLFKILLDKDITGFSLVCSYSITGIFSIYLYILNKKYKKYKEVKANG